MESAKIIKLLENKRFYLERLKQLYRECSICIDNSQIKLLLAKNKIVERLLGDLETIDAELAAMGIGPFGDGAGVVTREIISSIRELAKESQLALDSSETRLRNMRDDLRENLTSLVSNRQIGAYRPFNGRRPVYFDRVN